MTLPVVLADHGSLALSIAAAVPVLVVAIGIAVITLRDRRSRRDGRES